jgi:pSer/pThr/pTyr-binding forkhead associated (FHA) protein
MHDANEEVMESPVEEPVVEEANAQDEALPLLARLIVKRSGTETDETFMVNPPATIGRFDPAVGPIDVDLGPLPEGVYVSRKHAKIVNEDGVWKLVDLGSSNGTFVLRDDFERVDEAELADGTEFALGNARFVFKLS